MMRITSDQVATVHCTIVSTDTNVQWASRQPAAMLADVGAAAAVALANPKPHIGKLYELTGPRSLTMAERAREFSVALGRTIQYVDVPPQIREAKLREARFPPHLTAHLITMAELHRDNRYDRMTDTFQKLVGHAPISAAEFARRNAAAFTPA